eukprot:scaffold58169_cov68-Phaeocystis_antarctica.AAC.3
MAGMPAAATLWAIATLLQPLRTTSSRKEMAEREVSSPSTVSGSMVMSAPSGAVKPKDSWLVAREKLSQLCRVAAALHDGPLLVGREALLHSVGLGVGAWEWGALRVADKDERVDLAVYALALYVWGVGRHCKAGAVRVCACTISSRSVANWGLPRAALAFDRQTDNVVDHTQGRASLLRVSLCLNRFCDEECLKRIFVEYESYARNNLAKGTCLYAVQG